MIVIPNDPTQASHSIKIVLSGVEYQLLFHWHERAGSWYMRVLTPTGEALTGFMRLVARFFPLERFTDARLPAGLLAVVDVDSQGEIVEQSDLGGRVQLHYFTREELQLLLDEEGTPAQPAPTISIVEGVP